MQNFREFFFIERSDDTVVQKIENIRCEKLWRFAQDMRPGSEIKAEVLPDIEPIDESRQFLLRDGDGVVGGDDQRRFDAVAAQRVQIMRYVRLEVTVRRVSDKKSNFAGSRRLFPACESGITDGLWRRWIVIQPFWMPVLSQARQEMLQRVESGSGDIRVGSANTRVYENVLKGRHRALRQFEDNARPD